MKQVSFTSIFFAATALTVATIAVPAKAGSRYSTPPPAVLSADLTAPWVLQLQSRPTVRHPGTPQVYTTPGYQDLNNGPVVRTYSVAPRRVKRRVQRRVTRRNAHVQPAPSVVYAPRPAPAVQTRQASLQTSKPSRQFDPKFEPQIVSYSTSKSPGTIVIDTNQKFLYLVMGNGQARRYGVGVGRPGFEWAGTHKISRKAEWPDWRPPAQMIAREKEKGIILPPFVKGGPQNPLGSRALYLGSSLYRIHGTDSPWTIGKAVSSGCIRMRNEDVMDLYERVGVGTRVVVS